MNSSRMVLVALLVVGSCLSSTAHPDSPQGFSFFAPALEATTEPKQGTTEPNGEQPKSVPGWLSQCRHLGEDLEMSWNLTIVVAKDNWPVVEDTAKILFSAVTDCTDDSAMSILSNAKCLIRKLLALKNVLLPAVSMNMRHVKEAWNLIPKLLKSAKECF